METKKTRAQIKSIRSKLEQLSYVKTLKSLSVDERQFLMKEFGRTKSKVFYFNYPKNSIFYRYTDNFQELQMAIYDSHQKVRDNIDKSINDIKMWIMKYNLSNVQYYGGYNHIEAYGFLPITDETLIKRQQRTLEREAKIQKQRLAQQQTQKQIIANISIASKKDAENTIAFLKNKFAI